VPEMRRCVPGKTYFDGCNICRCHSTGIVSCTMKACEMYDPYTNLMILVSEIPPPADFWQS